MKSKLPNIAMIIIFTIVNTALSMDEQKGALIQRPSILPTPNVTPRRILTHESKMFEEFIQQQLVDYHVDLHTTTEDQRKLIAKIYQHNKNYRETFRHTEQHAHNNVMKKAYIKKETNTYIIFKELPKNIQKLLTDNYNVTIEESEDFKWGLACGIISPLIVLYGAILYMLLP